MASPPSAVAAVGGEPRGFLQRSFCAAAVLLSKAAEEVFWKIQALGLRRAAARSGLSVAGQRLA
jgi:hypothetical protein